YEYIPNETYLDRVPRNDSHEDFDPAVWPSTNPPTDPDHTATTTSNHPRPHPRSNRPHLHLRRTIRSRTRGEQTNQQPRMSGRDRTEKPQTNRTGPNECPDRVLHGPLDWAAPNGASPMPAGPLARPAVPRRRTRLFA